MSLDARDFSRSPKLLCKATYIAYTRRRCAQIPCCQTSRLPVCTLRKSRLVTSRNERCFSRQNASMKPADLRPKPAKTTVEISIGPAYTQTLPVSPSQHSDQRKPAARPSASKPVDESFWFQIQRRPSAESPPRRAHSGS